VTERTSWRLIALLVIAGVIGSFQVGKAAIALPLLRVDLELTLLIASFVFSAYSVLGAAAGLPAGLVISRLDARKTIIGGLLILGIGSCLGAVAPNGPLLLITRVIEGIGFIGVVIAAPTLIRIFTVPKDRGFAMTWWGVYMPAGTAIMMIGGPWLMRLAGWQSLWIVNGVSALIYAGVLLWALPVLAAEQHGERQPIGKAISSVLATPGPLMLGLAFSLYTFQYFAITGLLPVLLVERLGLSVAQAGALTALTVVTNAAGNLVAGVGLRLGVPMWVIFATAFGFLGVVSFGIFNETLPVAVIAALACATLSLTGLIPGTIFAAMPRLTRTAGETSIAFGLTTQASGIGQLIGPVVLAAIVEAFGWSVAPLLFVVIAACGIAIALMLRRILEN